MSKDIRIGLISGSLRKASFNTQLVQYVGKRAKELGGVELVTIDLNQLDLPMFSEDLEIDGLPQSALDLKELMISCDAFLISTPEYNGSISGALKNAIDWASRPNGDEPSLACFKGKVCGLLAASPGGLGGLRGMRHVRQILTQLQTFVIPQEYALGSAHQAFDENSDLKDEKAASFAAAVGAETVRVCQKLK
ncbi:MAG: NAD(P)H-dependent oxidoreductase [Phycisphaerales bacterium]